VATRPKPCAQDDKHLLKLLTLTPGGADAAMWQKDCKDCARFNRGSNIDINFKKLWILD